jgi:hypothetical protein
MLCCIGFAMAAVLQVAPDHPRVLLGGDRLVALKASLTRRGSEATRFRDMVDSQLKTGRIYSFRGHFAALLYQVTQDRRYADYAISFVDARVAADETQIASAQLPLVARDSYLNVGPLIGDVALTYDWCFDRPTLEQRQRWIAYGNQAVSNVWNPRGASWGGRPHPWNGWSVNNPSNNYYYSFLEATLLLGLATKGDNELADQWIRTFREEKLRDQLVPTFARDLEGGGSREGTGYGTVMGLLFRLYDVWEASTGERIAELTPQAKDSLLYMMHATLPTLDRFAPIGDHARDSAASLFDYQRSYIQILAWLFRSDPLAPVARWYLSHCSVPRMRQGFMYIYDYLYSVPGAPERPEDTLYPGYYAPGVGHLFLRSGWARDATWLGFIAGPYSESHAHRDQGSFLLFKNSWLAYDQNVGARSGIRSDEALHNLVRVVRSGSPVRMKYGKTARLVSLVDNPQYSYVAASLVEMYEGVPGIAQVEREIVFLKPNTLVIFDRLALDAPLQAIWTLNSPAAPILEGNRFTLKGSTSTLQATIVEPPTPRLEAVAWKETDPDMRDGYRIDVAATGQSGFLVVLSLDGAVRAIDKLSRPGQKGLSLVLNDGRSATVSFFEARPGGRLELGQSTTSTSSAPLVEPLAEGVRRLPTFSLESR